MTYSPILTSMYKQPDSSLYEAIKMHLENGQDPNSRSSYDETPLKQAFRRGRMDVVSLLVDNGADVADMQWTPIHKAIALSDLRAVLPLVGESDMSARDRFGLTPFLLACDIGDTEKTAALLPFSKPEDLFCTWHREPALIVAATKCRGAMVSWLLANGFNVDDPDEFGGTALITAAQKNDTRTVKILLAAGANIHARYDLSASVRNIDSKPDRTPRRESFITAAGTGSDDVARLLIAAGIEPHEFGNKVLCKLTGAAQIPQQQITPAVFNAQKHRIFGTKNPDSVNYEFWLEMMRTRKSGYHGHKTFGEGERDKEDPAIWSFSRFGMSTTALPDQRWVQIAGEHEDSYDQDFCIYNDVFLHDGNGHTQIFTYPKEVFPPTDFHTATLVDNGIILIGNLGYRSERQACPTQVFRLNLTTFAIERVQTSGKSPGWISRHKAKLADKKIIVTGGEVWDRGLVPSGGTFELSLATGVWQKLAQS